MQVIETDKGKFIDNMPGASFGSYAPGFDWKRHEGETVANVRVIRNSGYMWLNKPPLTAAEIEKRAEEVARQIAERTTADILRMNQIGSQERRRKKILIIGATAVNANDIIGIAKEMQIDKSRVVVVNEYDKNEIDIAVLSNRDRYDWILVGPTAHSILGLGDYSSLLSRITENKDVIVPYVVLSDYSGSLKITKESIKNAFRDIVKRESDNTR